MRSKRKCACERTLRCCLYSTRVPWARACACSRLANSAPFYEVCAASCSGQSQMLRQASNPFRGTLVRREGYRPGRTGESSQWSLTCRMRARGAGFVTDRRTPLTVTTRALLFRFPVRPDILCGHSRPWLLLASAAGLLSWRVSTSQSQTCTSTMSVQKGAAHCVVALHPRLVLQAWCGSADPRLQQGSRTRAPSRCHR